MQVIFKGGSIVTIVSVYQMQIIFAGKGKKSSKAPNNGKGAKKSKGKHLLYTILVDSLGHKKHKKYYKLFLH